MFDWFSLKLLFQVLKKICLSIHLFIYYLKKTTNQRYMNTTFSKMPPSTALHADMHGCVCVCVEEWCIFRVEKETVLLSHTALTPPHDDTEGHRATILGGALNHHVKFSFLFLIRERLMGDGPCPRLMLIFLELVLSHRRCYFLEDLVSEGTSRTHSTRIIQLWRFSRALETCVRSAFPKACHILFTRSPTLHQCSHVL